MAVATFPMPWQFFDDDGHPLAGGWIYTYQTGTSNAQSLYKTNVPDTAWSNPLHLDSAGRPGASVYGLATPAYDLVIKDANFNTILTMVNVHAVALA